MYKPDAAVQNGLYGLELQVLTQSPGKGPQKCSFIQRVFLSFCCAPSTVLGARIQERTQWVKISAS